MATFKELSQQLADLRDRASRAEGAKEQAEEQMSVVRNRIIEEGFNPETLADEIRQLEREVEEGAIELNRKTQQLSAEISKY